MQSKRESLVEGLLNNLSSFFISWVMQVTVIPYVFGITISAKQGIGIVALFTVVSLIRQYIIRRVFNYRLQRRIDATFKKFDDAAPGLPIPPNGGNIFIEPTNESAKIIKL